MSIDLQGQEKLLEVARQMQQAATTLQKSLTDAAVDAVEPLPEKISASALAKLPKSGGLAARVAGSFYTTTVAGTRVRFLTINRNLKGLRLIDGGQVRHPVYGNTEKWVTQGVTPRFWRDAIEAETPEIEKKMDKALDKVARKIGG